MSRTQSHPIPFTVDAALLQELGARLVGKSHIALAEFVKNAYDADAHRVLIRIGRDFIEVTDDGHGMDEEEFRKFWMRIGSPHKRRPGYSRDQGYSRKLHRPLTGSKGVGRLAVQFLGDGLEVRTSTSTSGSLVATVDWTTAIKQDELTSAEATVWTESVAPQLLPKAKSGTRFHIDHLTEKWDDEKRLRDVARQLWFLQPPFEPADAAQDFRIEFERADGSAIDAFDTQFLKHLDAWRARLVGEAVRGGDGKLVMQLSLQFRGKAVERLEYVPVTGVVEPLRFDIRVFNLNEPLPRGVSIRLLREYMNDHGGVRVYDAGFNLPHFSGRTQDWLGVERDHAHRLSRSQLLPGELQAGVEQGMNALPTTSRLLGAVHIDTGRYETKGTPDDERLRIQITRDRLVENAAFERLRNCVRWAIDYYAVQEQTRLFKEAQKEKKRARASESIAEAEEWLDTAKKDIPPEVHSAMKASLRDAQAATKAEEKKVDAHLGLLGSLATAGMAALAYEHEAAKQLSLLRRIVDSLRGLRATDERIDAAVREMDRWIERTTATRALFAPLLSAENRENQEPLRVRPLLEDVKRQVMQLMKPLGIEVHEIDDELRFPQGTWVEWSALFQNVFINAGNAMLDSERHVVRATAGLRARRAYVWVEDFGVGVDLATAEKLFEPFERRLKLSPERRGLGMGGSGLGLTIVRMIAAKNGCRVRFVEPTGKFKTRFELSWEVE